MDTLKKKMEINFGSTNTNKKVLEKYTELWDELKSQIKTTDNKPSEFGKKIP